MASAYDEVVIAAEPTILVEGVSKRWPERARWLRRSRQTQQPKVLDNVDLVVRRGEILCVLGENGAGKTTLLKIVGGLARADAGKVTLVGFGEPGSSPDIRRRISYGGGGERGFYYRLTARENMQLFATLDGLVGPRLRERIAAAIELVDLQAHLDKRFGDLSTGMRQRLSIARALLGEPDVLLLDEPTRALDPLHAAALQSLIRDTLARRYQKTVLVATNLIDEAHQLAGRVAVLRGAHLHELDMTAGRSALASVAEMFGVQSDA